MMTNVKLEVKGNLLTITVDLAQEHGLSASGKSTTIANTGGNVTVPYAGGEVKVGLNVYKPKK